MNSPLTDAQANGQPHPASLPQSTHGHVDAPTAEHPHGSAPDGHHYEMPIDEQPYALPIPYGRQNITEEDIAAVVHVLRSDFLTQGPAVAAFEVAFAAHVGAPYAVACANGTAALHLCTLALGVQPGDRVIVPPITFAASANCVRYCGGEVVFSDIRPDTFTLDVEKARALVEAHPRGHFKGIVGVDFAGHPADLEGIRRLCDEHGLWFVEDACHAPGATFAAADGRTHLAGSGSLADLAIFSFHPVKHIATGEGGMVTTASKELYEKLLMLRTHGITKDPALMSRNEGGWYMEMQTLGYNYRMPDILAALGSSQIARADEGLARRRAIATAYNIGLMGIEGLQLPHAEERVAHAYHLYVIQCERRKELYDFLRTKGIYTQVHYIPVHRMPYYEALGNHAGDHPVAELYYSRTLSLPMYPSMTDAQQHYVMDCIRAFFGGQGPL